MLQYFWNKLCSMQNDRYNMKPQNYKYESHVIMQPEGIFGTSWPGCVTSTGEKPCCAEHAPCVTCPCMALPGTPQYWFRSSALFPGKGCPYGSWEENTSSSGHHALQQSCLSASLSLHHTVSWGPGLWFPWIYSYQRDWCKMGAQKTVE